MATSSQLLPEPEPEPPALTLTWQVMGMSQLVRKLSSSSPNKHELRKLLQSMLAHERVAEARTYRCDTRDAEVHMHYIVHVFDAVLLAWLAMLLASYLPSRCTCCWRCSAMLGCPWTWSCSTCS